MSQLAEMSRQFLRFAGVGVIGTAGHYATLIVLVELLGVDPVVGSTVGFVVGAAINYYLNRIYTFESKVLHRVGMPKFFAVATIGMLINTSIMAMLIHLLGVAYLLAQIIATGLVLLWNFLGNRFWTFNDGRSPSNR